MSNLGSVSVLNINGNELTIKDSSLTSIVNEIVEAIGENNTDISNHINDLNNKSFDGLIKIGGTSQQSLDNIQDGIYKVQYIHVESEEVTEEVIDNSKLIFQHDNIQLLIGSEGISTRSKSNNTWSSWTALSNFSLTFNYSMSSNTNENLLLASGDTYEEAFGKLEKSIIDNELTVTHALNDLNQRIEGITVPEFPITSVNGQTGAVIINVPVTSVNGATGDVIISSSLSNNYVAATAINEDLFLDSGDSYETAFGKIEKRIEDNELTVTHALNDLNQRIEGITIPLIPVTSVNGQTGAVTIDHPVTSVNGQTGAVTIDHPVTSVNGQTGVVTINTGVLSFNGNTGSIIYSAPVTSVNGQTGAVTLNLNSPVTSVNGQTGAVTLSIPDDSTLLHIEDNTIVEDYITANDLFIHSAYINNGELNGTLIVVPMDVDESHLMGKIQVGWQDYDENNDEHVSIGGWEQFINIASGTEVTLQDELDARNNLVTSVNGQTGAVTITSPVTSVNGTTGAITINALPAVTAADNGKILMVVNGEWTLVSPSTLYSGSGVPNNANGNNGDLFIQTD